MAPTFRLARLAGIEISANWTWVLVVALVVWSLAASVFPDTNPGLGDLAYVAMAVVAALLFFVSLLAHELGHALQARREGVAIEGITLWAFGGVARIRGTFPTAGAELRVAVAGPAVSLAIGAVCVAIAALLPLPSAVDAVIAWLGYINLVLLVFNLIPAFPMDGGRMLRAALWRATHDFTRATRWAAIAGQGFGLLFIAAGVVTFALGGELSGLWLAFIGFFVITAAQSELAMAETRTIVSGIRVADVMVPDPVTVAPDLTAERFIDDVFFAHRHTAYPVVADGAALGLISFRDVLAVPRAEWHRVRVADRMHGRDDVLVVEADRDLADVLPDLAQHELRRALVAAEGRPVGLLSITDVTRVLEVLPVARAAPGAVARPRAATYPRGRPAMFGR